MIIITNSVLEITKTYDKNANQTDYSSEVVAVFDDFRKAKAYIEKKINDVTARHDRVSWNEYIAFVEDVVIERRYEIYTFRLD